MDSRDQEEETAAQNLAAGDEWGAGPKEGMALSWDRAEALYDRLAPSVAGLVVASTKRWADVEDHLHDTLLKVVQAGEVEDLERYALRATANALKRQGRQAWRWRSLEDAPQVRSESGPNPEDDVADRHSRAEQARLRLSGEDRQILELCVSQGRPDSEVAGILGLSADSVRKRLERATGRLREAWFQDAIGGEAALGSCRKALGWMLLDAAGNLNDSGTARLSAHLDGCPECRDRRQLVLNFKKTEGLAALLPIPPAGAIDESKPRVVARLVAALEQGASRPPPPGRGRLWPRRLALGLLLLLLFLLSAPTPPAIAIRARVASLNYRKPSPAPPIAAIPTSPSPAAVTAANMHQPSPAPAPIYVSPCPPDTIGGYAYLHEGEVYYRSAVGAAAVRLTSTGGRVDNFWWAPDGQRLAYKVPSSLPNIRGDVRVIALSTGAQLWDLDAPVDFFSFSPDGTAWAAGAIDAPNGVLTGVNVLEAKFPLTGNQAQTFTATDSDGSSGNPPTPVQFDWSVYQDRPPILESVLHPDAGIFWQRSGIYEHLDGLAHLYDPAGSWLSDIQMTVPVLDQLEGFPSNSAFALGFGGVITRTCVGTVASTAQPELMGMAYQMAISSDGRTGLISVHDAGFTFDVVRLYADGRVRYLSRDGVTELPLWRP